MEFMNGPFSSTCLQSFTWPSYLHTAGGEKTEHAAF